jgi:hypothetical protein
MARYATCRESAMSSPVALRLSEVTMIEMQAEHRSQLIEHARRKLRGEYRESETPHAQAFGLLAGTGRADAIRTTDVFPLRRNLRADPVRGAAVDVVVRELAIDSGTPIEQRGWIASPEEVIETQERCDADGTVLFGTYHMHKVPWRQDPLRDTPTALDTALGAGQGLWMLILSMVDPDRPILRAFWEGRPEAEAKLLFT